METDPRRERARDVIWRDADAHGGMHTRSCVRGGLTVSVPSRDSMTALLSTPRGYPQARIWSDLAAWEDLTVYGLRIRRRT